MSADAVHGRGSLATVVIVNCNYEKFVRATLYAKIPNTRSGTISTFI